MARQVKSKIKIMLIIFFDTIEVIETGSQAVLNSLTVQNFQDAFKKWQKQWNGSYARNGTASSMMVTSRPKVSF
jgi:hypothetical protein